MATNGFLEQMSAGPHDVGDGACELRISRAAQRANIEEGVGAVDEPQRDVDGEEVTPRESPVAAEGRLKKKILAFNRFVDETQRGLEPTAALLWLTLFRHARDGVAKVSQSRLAEQLGLSTKSIQRGIEKLRRLDLVKIKQHGGNGRGCHSYQLGLCSLDSRPKKRPQKPKPK